jgi:hypothetical protein
VICPECWADTPGRAEQCGSCGLVFRRWIRWTAKPFQRERGFVRDPESPPLHKGPLWAFALLLLAGAVIQVRRLQPPPLAYRDVSGGTRRLLDKGRPALLVFWTASDALSQRAMLVLNGERLKYRPEELDVIGLYVGDADDAAIKQEGLKAGYLATLGSAARAGAMLEALGADAREPGASILIVTRKGRVLRIDAGAKIKARRDIEVRLDEALWKEFPDLRSTGRFLLQR